MLINPTSTSPVTLSPLVPLSSPPPTVGAPEQKMPSAPAPSLPKQVKAPTNRAAWSLQFMQHVRAGTLAVAAVLGGLSLPPVAAAEGGMIKVAATAVKDPWFFARSRVTNALAQYEVVAAAGHGSPHNIAGTRAEDIQAMGKVKAKIFIASGCDTAARPVVKGRPRTAEAFLDKQPGGAFLGTTDDLSNGTHTAAVNRMIARMEANPNMSMEEVVRLENQARNDRGVAIYGSMANPGYWVVVGNGNMTWNKAH